MNVNDTTKNEKGQSLFEVVLALGVITAITVGIVSLAVSSIRNATFSKNKTLAGRYVQEATEWLRSERDNDFTTFQGEALTAPGTPMCFPTLAWTGSVGVCGASETIANTPLFREITFSATTISGKTVIDANVRVYWTDAQGGHEVRSSTSFTDWRQR
jgi:Tfp pilus assembly protein PilV